VEDLTGSDDVHRAALESLDQAGVAFGPRRTPPAAGDRPDTRRIGALVRAERLLVQASDCADEGELVEIVKSACARRGLPYDTSSVRRALDSERYKAAHLARRAS
jgi:hypothetical protein